MSTSETLQSVGRSKNACMESLRSRAVPQNAHAFELWDTVNCLRGSFFLDKYAFTVFSQTSWAPPAPTWTLKNKGIYSRATYPPSCKPPPTTFAHFPAKPPRAAYTSEYGILWCANFAVCLTVYTVYTTVHVHRILPGNRPTASNMLRRYQLAREITVSMKFCVVDYFGENFPLETIPEYFYNLMKKQNEFLRKFDSLLKCEGNN